jgi:hypothetical protein
MGNGYFGFKDPRTFRLMPMCHQIINELKLAPESSSAQSAAAAKSMEVQLAMAQSAMAAARQFGSPAINALAIDERTPIAYPRLGGLEGDGHTGAVWRGWRRLNHSFRTTGSALPRPKPAGRVSSHPRAPN